MGKKLFLIDGLGAIISAFMLGIVLVNFENVFGMPKNILYLLSIIPCFFAVYSFYCYFKSLNNWRFYLKTIAIANLLYCLLTISLVIHLYEKPTFLGLIYFILELIVIGVLIIIELKTATTLTRENS